jgi:hypothetical protein
MKCSVFVTLFAVVGLSALAPASTIPGDLNGDMVVDLADYLVYQRQLAGEPCVPRTEGRAGRNGDPCFNTDDLAAFEGFVQADLDCDDRSTCTEIFSPSDCRWGGVFSVSSVAVCTTSSDCAVGEVCVRGRCLACSTRVDPTERRMCELGIFLNGQVDEFFGPNGCFLPSTDPPGGQCNCGDPIDSEAPCPPCLGGCPDEAFLPRPGEDAIGHIDRIGDGSGTSDPGCFGVAEQPLTNFTSGFNIGCSVLWFVPDDDVKYCSDGAPCTTHADCGGGESCEAERCVGQDSCSTDADCGGGECVDVDRSLLYVAWDISDLVTALGTIPSQYDSDGDGSACRRAEGAPLEGDRENYRTQLRSCVDLNEFNPKEANTVSLQLRADAAVDFFINENLGEPLVTSIPAVRFINPPPLEVLSFPTADGAVSPINACIDQEVRVCTGKLSSGAPCANFCSDDPTLPCRHDGDCVEADAGTCEDDGTCVYGDNINNVESVIKRVETSGWFGPHTGRLCSISLRPCRGLGIDACPAGEGTCTEMAPVAPDSERARQNRIALSRLAALLFADTNSDRNVGGDEEEAVVALRTPLPELEVAKQVRCADDGQSEFSAGPVEALPGSEVEFAITIRNPGNEDLEILVLDELTDIHPQVNCAVDCENPFLRAGLIRPSEGIGGTACTQDDDCPAGEICLHDAKSKANVCHGLVTPADALDFGLEAQFFVPDCDLNGSFLNGVQNSVPVEAGILRGASVNRSDDGACQFIEGDTLTVYFRAKMGVKDDELFCVDRRDEDCQNRVSAEGRFLGGLEVSAEAQSEIVEVDVLCRDITFMKAVGFPDEQGSFVTGAEVLSLPSVPPAGFVDMEYLYIVDNIGETDESITISDPELCSDVSDTMAAFPGGIAFVDCGLCTVAPVGSVGPILLGPGDGMHAESCLIRFNSQAAMRHFLALDNDREPCNEKDPGLSGDDCYRNCATASAVATNLGEICRPPNEAIIRDSFTTVCNSQCELEVRKQVRCLPDCDPESLSGEEGWVEDPSQLDVAPGACVEYRIITTNLSPEDVLLCALKYNDVMSGAVNFQSGPTDVSISRNCSNLDFSTAFNWLGDDVLCLLESPLAKNDSVVVRFQAQLKPADEVELNVKLNNDVLVLGASENDCPEQGEPSFSCMDRADVDIETLGCDFELTKDVTCDDPRDPEAVFTADIVAALPGSKVGFRIRVENTGKVNLPRINITEDLSCSTWFEAGSVVADIDGSDVLACICPGGCNSIGALGGMKDLSGCGGFSPGELLTITFEVKVPAMFNMMGTGEDCLNTVTVTAETDSCSSDEKDPCPEREDFARINVDVPRIVCDKEVCADPDDIEGCDNGFSEIVEIDGADANYPLSIIYKLSATNTGETDLINARICDPDLIDDLTSLGAGVEIGPCAINPATGCASLGMLAPGASQMATCEVKFLTEMAWFEFAGRDEDRSGDCYTNTSRAFADVDPSDYCTREAGLDVQSTDCEAKVCVGMSRIPTMSEWGLVILALLLLVVYKIHFGGRRVEPA